MADNILRLRVDSQEYDAKLKKAAEGIRHLADAAHKGGGELTGLEKAELDYIKALGGMETKSRTASGQARELANTYKELKVVYNQLNEVEKADEGGKALATSLETLRQRAQEAKKELSDVTAELNDSKFGQFGSVIDTIGQKIGITGNLTEMLTSKTALMTAAIGAGGAAAGKAAEMWASYNSEIAKQDNVVTVTTGLKDDDAKRMTDAVRALAGTYNVDFRDAVNAANTLMTQFGKTGDEAIQLLRDGMQGMIQGDGGKLLSMIQQYAPSFRDAGIEASQLVAIIQNSEGGIFTDQNMNAIVMGIKNIRLMTNATSEALQKVGIDSEEMTKKLNSGSMTIFEALRQVSNAIENTGSSSQAAGEVMQQVFGRQGAMAGTKLGEAIATLNTNLEDTKKQTGDLGNAYRELEIANENLNKAIRDCFEYDGWEVMKTEIETGLVTALSDVLNSCKSLYGMLEDIGSLKVFEFIASSVLRCVAPFTQLYRIAKELFKELGGSGSGDAPRPRAGVKNLADDPNVDDNGNYRVKNVKNNKPRLVSKPGEPVRYEDGTVSIDTGTNSVKPVKPKNIHIPRASSSSRPQTEMQKNQSEITKLTQEYVRLGDSETEASRQRQAEIQKEIQLLEKRNGLLKLREEQAHGRLLGNTTDITNVQDLSRTGGLTGFVGTGKNMMPVEGLPSMSDVVRQRGGNLLDDKAMKAVNEDISRNLPKAKEKDSPLESGKKLLNGISKLTDGLEKIGIDIPDEIQSVIGVIQGVMQVIEAVNTIIGVTQTTALTANTAAIMSLEVALWANTASSVIPFANGGVVHAAGGIVAGNTYSGDQIPAMLNAGEVVLNRAQVGNLASQLENGASQNLNLDAVITGEQIRLVLNNNSRRRGKGEYVTSKIRKS